MKPSQIALSLKKYLSIDESVGADVSWYKENPICFSSIYHDNYSKAVLISFNNSSGPIQLMGSNDIWPGDVLLVRGSITSITDLQYGEPKQSNMVQSPNVLFISVSEKEKHVLLKNYVGEPYQPLK